MSDENDSPLGRPPVNVTSTHTRPKRQNAKPSPITFNPHELDTAIEDQGSWVRITPAIVCPNQDDVHTGNHALDCELCGGDRTIDLTERAFETWARVGGPDLHRQMEVQGVYDLKDAHVTFKSTVRVYYWYKIEVLDFSSTFNELLRRTSDDFDHTRYPPSTNSTDIPFLLVDSNGKRYTKDADFQVETEGIRWIGESPGVGQVYSISYPILPTFRVIELINENRYYYQGFKQKHRSPIQMPQQVLARWDYLARGQGQNEPRDV